jgi:hypothetical protein
MFSLSVAPAPSARKGGLSSMGLDRRYIAPFIAFVVAGCSGGGG